MDYNKEKAETIIAKVMNEFQFRHQYEVAEYFGVTAQTLSGWVKTGIIPDKYILKFQLDIQNTPPRKGKIEQNNFEMANDHAAIENNFSFTVLFANHIKPLILVSLLSGLLTCIAVFFIVRPVYTSTAKVLPIGEKGNSFSDMAGMATQLGLSLPMNMGNEIPWDEMFPEIVKSENLKENILTQQFNSDKYGIDQSLNTIIENEYKLSDEPNHIRNKMILDKLNELINVSKSRLSPIVTINVDFFEPQLAGDILSAVIQESGKALIKLKSKQISEKRKFIEERISEVFESLKMSEVALKDFQESNRKPDRSPALKLEESRLEREVTLHNSLYVTLKSQFENVKIEEVEESAMIQVVDGPIVPFRLTKPKRFLSIVFAMAITFFGLFFIFYLKDFTISGKEKESEVRREARNRLKNQIRWFVPFIRRSGK